jgi:hypothetical protein
MSKPYDATLNRLIDTCPNDWAAFLATRVGLAPQPAEVIDSDLSVTVQADKVFRLPGPPPALIHLEAEVSSRRGVPRRLNRYNALLDYTYDEPVHSVVVLLRPEADASDLTGVHTRTRKDGRVYLRFEYDVVRVWNEPIDGLLAAGLGTAPLALLTDEAVADLPGAVDRFRDQLRGWDLDRTVVDEVLGSALVLCGLRHDSAQVTDLFRRLSMTLEESSTYQWILNKGVAQGIAQGRAEGVAQGVAQGTVEELWRVLILLGRKRFGVVPATVEAAVRGVADQARLERMAERIFDAANWDDLLATP